MNQEQIGTGKWDDEDPIALAYDETMGGELVAKVYTLEVVAELKDCWWISVERIDETENADGSDDLGSGSDGS